jgi:hypothetical protein
MRCLTYVTLPFPTPLVNDLVKQDANSLSNKYHDYDAAGLIYLLTAIGLTPGGSSTVHILHTNNTQNNTMEQNTQNRTYVTVRINTHNKSIQFTKVSATI